MSNHYTRRLLFLAAVLFALIGVPVVGQVSYKGIFAFGDPDLTTTGANPFGRLVQGRDGALYGTTTSYPFTGSPPGVVFRLDLDGSGFRVLHRFGSVPGDGAAPVFGVIEGSDGYLYGNSHSGGTLGFGTIFRLNKEGADYTVLRSFQSSPNADGAVPQSGLIEGQDGRLYGTTSSGGTGFVGTLFTINKDGSGYAILRHFTAPGNGPSNPFGIIQGSDGVLYGTTISGGAGRGGVVFRVNSNGAGFTVLYELDRNADNYPLDKLFEDSDGFLYCTTQVGRVFKLSKNGTGFTFLKDFSTSLQAFPHSLVEGDDGMLYGVTENAGSNGFGAVYRMRKDGGDFAEVYAFTGKDGDGHAPGSGLLKAADGSLYGTAQFGGKSGPSGTLLDSYGTVFALRKGLRLAVQQIVRGSMRVTCIGIPNASHTFLSVTNFNSLNWTPIASRVADANGLVELEDPQTTGASAKFYRVSQP